MAAESLSDMETPAEVAAARRRQRLAVGFLFAMMLFNYMDRGVLNILVEPLKRELHLSDVQIGALGGLSFALLHVLMGIPIARLADRLNRVSIITIALVTWSALTAVCGIAQSFAQLFALRVGIGVGEAGGAAPGSSIISDLFPPKRRSYALGWMMLGVPLGSMLGGVVGGFVAHHWGWRAAFVVVGLPGLVLALAMKFWLAEPKRGAFDPPNVKQLAPISLWKSFGTLLRIPTFIFFTLGGTLANLGNQGINQFNAAYYVRRFGLDLSQAGLIIGLAGAAAAVGGILLGGTVCTWAAKRDARWFAWFPAAAMMVAAPLTVTVFAQGDWVRTLLFQLVTSALTVIYIAPTLGTIQNLSPPLLRATSIALFNLLASGLGYGFGPMTVGLLGDRAARAAFTAAGHGQFHASCPGGIAPLGAATDLKAACLQASTAGIQQALSIAAVAFALAGIAFFFAGRTLRPNLVEEGADLAGRPIRIGIGAEQVKHQGQREKS